MKKVTHLNTIEMIMTLFIVSMIITSFFVPQVVIFN